MDVTKSLIMSQLLLEANDSLVGTRFYKQEFKRDLNNCIGSLERFTEQYYKTMYDNDPEMVTNILNKIESLVDTLKTSSIEDLIMIESIINKYNSNKDQFRETEEVIFNKIK